MAEQLGLVPKVNDSVPAGIAQQEQRAERDRISEVQEGLQRQTKDFLRLFGRSGGFNGRSGGPPILGR
jgi:hypothetical protein